MYVYAVISSLIWAVSAPIVTLGLRQIPAAEKFRCIACGLLVSLVTGSLTLFLFFAKDLSLENVSLDLALAGFFTFPLATGLYYLCGAAMGGRMEIASQYARVKPLFSIAMAILVAKEQYNSKILLSVLLILIGTSLLIRESRGTRANLLAPILGLATAMMWSIGELFIKIGSKGPAGVDALVSLLAGTGVWIVLTGPLVLTRPRLLFGRWIVPFAVHGALSFGLGYASYYQSIQSIGLSATIAVTAGWPTLSLLMVWGIARLRGSRLSISKMTWAASGLLVSGSLIQFV